MTSNAERQRAYRERHLHDIDGKSDRLSMVISMHTKTSLERLASCYGVTQKAMLEMLVDKAERDLLEAATRGQRDGYYKKRLRMEWSVTQ
ncbi:MAG: hypothetical protein M0Z85_02570 [Gammaproteobacteria bacterium]|nr:hypothetical protein [Gammaproteobacteria bacterium]